MTDTSFTFKPEVGQKVRIVKDLYKDGDENFPLKGLVGTIIRVYDIHGWETVDIRLHEGQAVSGKLEGIFGIDVEQAE